MGYKSLKLSASPGWVTWSLSREKFPAEKWVPILSIQDLAQSGRDWWNIWFGGPFAEDCKKQYEYVLYDHRYINRYRVEASTTNSFYLTISSNFFFYLRDMEYDWIFMSYVRFYHANILNTSFEFWNLLLYT